MSRVPGGCCCFDSINRAAAGANRTAANLEEAPADVLPDGR
jgi:hypothetical protein